MKQRPARIATVGAALSANKGAASMLLALVDRAVDRPSTEVTVLTTYPEEDLPLLDRSVGLAPMTPRQIIFPMLPLAILIWFLRLVGVPASALAWAHPTVRVLAEADVVADLAGICFSDGRGIPTLAYNVLMAGIPILLGTPVVKCSQAIGPMQEPITRIAAGWVLPHVSTVVARGDSTERHLEALKLRNVRPGADLAFLLRTSTEDEREARRLVGDDPYVVVAPSAVVQEKVDVRSATYVAAMAETIRGLRAETGHRVVVAPHAARPGRPASRMNDLPVCREIVAETRDEGVVLLDSSPPAGVLRAVIGGAEALVTSRFHGMISGLATSTPTIVIGWSHKYLEVMQVFDQARFVIDHDDLAPDAVVALTLEALRDAGGIRSHLAAVLPSVQESALVSIDEVFAVAGGEGRA